MIKEFRDIHIELYDKRLEIAFDPNSNDYPIVFYMCKCEIGNSVGTRMGIGLEEAKAIQSLLEVAIKDLEANQK